MKLITSVALSFALTVSVTVSCFAQTSTQYKAKIKSQYDASMNETTVLVHPYLLVLASNNHDPTELITLTVSFTYTGQTVTAPPSDLKLSVISHARFRWEYEKDAQRTSHVKVDGEMISLGIPERVEARRVPLYSTLGDMTMFYYVEQLAIFIPAEISQKIANGKKVIIRVGKYEHKVSNKHLKILGEVVSRMRIK